MTVVSDLPPTNNRNHLYSFLPSLRSLLFYGVYIAIGLQIFLTGFLISSFYTVKGRQDVILTRLDTLDKQILATREDFSYRAGNITTSTFGTLATVNERIKDLSAKDAEFSRHLYEIDKRIWGGSSDK